jgi:DNA-directed RNA polymerase specialized sigma24 family protein
MTIVEGEKTEFMVGKTHPFHYVEPPGRRIALESRGARGHVCKSNGGGVPRAAGRRRRRVGVSPRVSSPTVLTGTSLERLLGALDGDREAAGHKYEAMRQGVVRFFEWRGCGRPEEYADRAIDRAARKLEEGAAVPAIYPYVLGIARFVLKEFWREQQKEQEALRALGQPTTIRISAECERRAACIDRCLEGLEVGERELILEYYRDDKRRKIDNRRGLADRLGVPATTLRMRAHRLRLRLESCVGRCAKI